MTAPSPVTIPLDERGAPDLQLLVRALGEAAAAARGEAYDPANNPAHAGYPRITPDIWRAFDEAISEFHKRPSRRTCTGGAYPANPMPPTFGPIEHHWPYVRCEECSAEARFGYRSSTGDMHWFCAAHRLAKNWADARRGGWS